MLLLIFFATIAYSQPICVRDHNSGSNCGTMVREMDLNCSGICSALNGFKWAIPNCGAQTITYYSNSLCTLDATTAPFDICTNITFGSSRSLLATNGTCFPPAPPTLCLGTYSNAFCHNSNAQYLLTCDENCVQFDLGIPVWVKTFCTATPTIEYYSDSQCTMSTIATTSNFSVCSPTYTTVPFAYAVLGTCPISAPSPMCIETFSGSCTGVPNQTTITCSENCTQVGSIWAKFSCSSNLVDYYNDSDCAFLYVEKNLASTQCSSIENTAITAKLGNCRPLPVCVSIFHQNSCSGNADTFTLRCDEECAQVSISPPMWAKINCGSNNATFYNDSTCSPESMEKTVAGSQCNSVVPQLFTTLTDGACFPTYTCYTTYVNTACTGIDLYETLQCGVCSAISGYYILPNCLTGTAIKSNNPDCSDGVPFNFDTCTEKYYLTKGSCSPKNFEICVNEFQNPGCFNLHGYGQLNCDSCFNGVVGSYGLDCNQNKLIQYFSSGCQSESYLEYPLDTCTNGIQTYNGTCLAPPNVCLQYYDDIGCNVQTGYYQLPGGNCGCDIREHYDFGVNCITQEVDLFASTSQCSGGSNGSYAFDICYTIPNIGNVKFANESCVSNVGDQQYCLARYSSNGNSCNGQLSTFETVGCNLYRSTPSLIVFGVCNTSIYSGFQQTTTTTSWTTFSSIEHNLNQCFPDANGNDVILLDGACSSCESVSLTIVDTPVSTFLANCSDLRINHLAGDNWTSASNAIQNVTTNYCFNIDCTTFVLYLYGNVNCSGIPITYPFSGGCISITLGDEVTSTDGIQASKWISVSPETTCNVSCSTVTLRNITFVVSGTGSGTVTTSNQYAQNFGIDCGLVCSGLFLDGSVITYLLVPDIGSTFAGGDLFFLSGQFNSDGDQIYSVIFDLIPPPPPSPSPSPSISPSPSPSVSPSPSISSSQVESSSQPLVTSPSPSPSSSMEINSSESIVPSPSSQIEASSVVTSPSPSPTGSPSPSPSISIVPSPSQSESSQESSSSEPIIPSSSQPDSSLEASSSESIVPSPSSQVESISSNQIESSSVTSDIASSSQTESSELVSSSQIESSTTQPMSSSQLELPSSELPSSSQPESSVVSSELPSSSSQLELSSSEVSSTQSELPSSSSIPATSTQMISSSVYSSQPIPTPTPIPTGCLREYSSSNCTGNYTFQNVLNLPGCTNINMTYPILKSVNVASGATIYGLNGCIGSITGTTSLGVCVKYVSPLTGSFIVNGFDCQLPNAIVNITPPAPPPPPGPAPPNVNCIYLYTSLGCVTPSFWTGLPCDGYCTQISPSLWAATSCGLNVTGLYSDSNCNSAALVTTGNLVCGTIPIGNTYRSVKTLFNSTCPPLPPAPAPAPLPAPAPPSGPACFKNYSLPSCGGIVTQTDITCQTCFGGRYFVDCNANLIRVANSQDGCITQSGTFNFDICNSASLKFTLGVCPTLPPPPPPPPPSNQTCVSFYLGGTCSGLKIDEPYSGYCWNTSTDLPSGFFTDGPSLYQSFKFDCASSQLIFYTASTCSGPSALSPIGNPGCSNWNTGAVLLAMSTPQTVCGPCIRTLQHTIHLFFK